MRDLLYIGGGIVAGWAIGKMLFGNGSIRPNASKPKRPGDPDRPTHEELDSSLPAFDPDDRTSLDPIQRLNVAMPEFVEDVSLWSTASPSYFLVLLEDEPIGVVEKKGDKYNAYFPVYDDPQVTLVEKTTPESAIGAVYTAYILIAYLKYQRGSLERSQDIAETLNIPLSLINRMGEALVSGGRTVERSQDIAEALNIPLSFINKVGEALASGGRTKDGQKVSYLFGISGEFRVEPTLRQEKVIIPGMPPLSGDPALRERQRKERKRAKRRRLKGRKPKIEHKRRKLVGGKADVAKLRKSEALTKEEKKELPEAKIVQRYSFGLFGPGNIVGMYGAQEGQKKFTRLLKQRRLEEKQAREAAEEEEKTVGGETIIDKGRPYYESPEETIRKLLTSPEEIPSDAFFEDKRLEALDWLSRQRKQQYLARKVDAAMKRVEQLREALEAAAQRRESAKRAGDSTRELQAVAQQTEIRSELDEVLEKLERAQKALHDE